ncbi:MAG: PRC-barrel domain-containing protein [Coriobacteriia bacterium]|nr:PRC-barrel domain-containing protein [Coriobacteriia bacterium]
MLKPHGTHGEVSVAMSAGLPSSCLEGIDLFLVPPGPRGARAFRATSVRPGPKAAIVRFDEDATAGAAGALAGRWLLAHETDTPAALTSGADELIGMQVVDAIRGRVGTVTDVIVTGANDVLVVEGPVYGQVLVPVIDDVVEFIDKGSDTIRVALLDGLIEGEDR